MSMRRPQILYSISWLTSTTGPNPLKRTNWRLTMLFAKHRLLHVVQQISTYTLKNRTLESAKQWCGTELHLSPNIKRLKTQWSLLQDHQQQNLASLNKMTCYLAIGWRLLMIFGIKFLQFHVVVLTMETFSYRFFRNYCKPQTANLKISRDFDLAVAFDVCSSRFYGRHPF